jgi:hypothetical protein
MGNRLYVNYDSKSTIRKDISVRFRAQAPTDIKGLQVSKGV